MAEILKDTTANKIGTGDGGLALDPSGSEVVTISNGIVIPDGTKTEPAIRLSDDVNTGIYSPVDESIALVGNGEEVIRATGVSSAVNTVEVVNSATGSDLIIKAIGTDTDIDIDIQSKGAGSVLINGVAPGGLTTVTAGDVDAEASADGYVLTSDGAGNAAWEAAAGGGSSTPETYADGSWVKEDSTTTGTGTVDLEGAVSGFKTFDDLFSIGDLVDYKIVEGANWETGQGTIASTSGALYWRLYVTAGGDGAYHELMEFELRTEVDGVSVAVGHGGTATATNNYSGFGPERAFDGLSTTWLSSNASTPYYIQYEFNSPQNIIEYKLQQGSTNRMPTDWTLEYSDNGTDWTTADTRSGQAKATATYTVGSPIVEAVNALERTTIFQSTNSGSAITLAGAATVATAIPATRARETTPTMGLTDLTDVNTAGVTSGNVLVADGVDFESRALVEADISDLGTYLTTVTASTIDAESSADGYVLTSDGAGNAAWEEVAGGGGSSYIVETYTGTVSSNTGVNNIVIGTGANTTRDYCVVVGQDASAAGDSGVAIGTLSDASANSVAVGYYSQATGGSSTAIGPDAQAVSTDSIAIGDARSDNSYAISIGDGADAGGYGSLALGSVALSAGAYGIGIGHLSRGQGEYSIGLGQDCQAYEAYSTIIGNRDVGNFTSGGLIGTMSLVPGQARGQENDLKRPRQLYSMFSKITSNATPLKLEKYYSTKGDYFYTQSQTIITGRVRVVANKRFDATVCNVWNIDFTFRMGATAATSTFLEETKTLINQDDAAWDVDLVADTSNGGFYIEATGDSTDSVTWAALIDALWLRDS